METSDINNGILVSKEFKRCVGGKGLWDNHDHGLCPTAIGSYIFIATSIKCNEVWVDVTMDVSALVTVKGRTMLNGKQQVPLPMVALKQTMANG